MNKNKKQSGFTLMESLVYLAVLGIVLLSASPFYEAVTEYRRITSMASEVFQDLRMAKSEAIKRNSRVRVTIKALGSGIWCYGWKINEACDCFSGSSCNIDGTVLRKSHQEYSQILLTPHLSSPGNRLTFDNTRMFMANTYGHIRVKTASKEIRVIVSPAGRVRLCSPLGMSHVIGYSSSC
jgi:type IV fimbrial biogenesis protein FimT